MAGSGIDFLNLAIPGSRFSNVNFVHPSLAGSKRASITDEFLAMGDAALAKRPRAAESQLAANGLAVVQSTLPAEMRDRVTQIDAGVSTLDAQTDEVMVHQILIQPYLRHHAWEQALTEFTPLFVNRDPRSRGPCKGIYRVSSIPILNAILEAGEAAVGRGRRVKVQGEALKNASALFHDYSSLVTNADGSLCNAVEVMDANNFLGVMIASINAGGIYSSDGAVRMAQGYQRQIGYSRVLRVEVANFFSPDARPGDRIYLVARDTDTSGYDALLDPSGVSFARRSAFQASSLQITGMTDRGGGILPHASSCTSADRYWADAGCADPGRADIDYMRREHAVAQEFTHFDFDVDNEEDVFRVRNLVGQEGIQEAVASVPQLVYEAYMEGAAVALGVVRTTVGKQGTAQQIARAHRSHGAMADAGILKIHARLGPGYN